MNPAQENERNTAATSSAAAPLMARQTSIERRELMVEDQGALQPNGAIEAQLIEWIKGTVRSNNELTLSLERWLNSHAILRAGRALRDEDALLKDTERALRNAAIAKKFLVDPVGGHSE